MGLHSLYLIVVKQYMILFVYLIAIAVVNISHVVSHEFKEFKSVKYCLS